LASSDKDDHSGQPVVISGDIRIEEKFERAIEVILCNFVAVLMCEPDRSLMVRFGNYASTISPVFGRNFNRAVDLMVDRGLISKHAGYRYRVGAKARKPSQIKATPLLTNQLSGANDWSCLRLDKYDRLIVLNESEKKSAPATRPLACWLEAAEADMVRINDHLRQADFEGDPRGIVHLAEVPRSIADFILTPHHRTVRRIFNGNYDGGGRIFGGWWETLERSKRFACIRIKGEPVVNVDYGQLFLRLAYASSNTPPPAGDLYDLSGADDRRNDWRELREGRKKLVNALISNSEELKQWPGKTARERAAVRACFPTGTTVRAEAQAIKERHHAIAAEWFERGRALELMRRQSDMLVAVLLRLISVGVTALPLHDSVIVARSDAPIAKRAMEDVAEMFVSVPIPVKVESGRDCGQKGVALHYS
jgi:hypothetical protein